VGAATSRLIALVVMAGLTYILAQRLWPQRPDFVALAKVVALATFIPLISAMGGVQSLDRMSGFRRALPFTFGCFVVGGLALSGR